eukprot:TRINITY_DN7697_c0_g1_i2.p1 TRINITY_DN7697_c0_g1~~TRINITY_DN7697_c0_g1_i2.p1  ORF type:complete len:351 (-),score=72.91 TRINITY_DN7697_c0_g1_i2:62-1114(-)
MKARAAVARTLPGRTLLSKNAGTLFYSTTALEKFPESDYIHYVGKKHELAATWLEKRNIAAGVYSEDPLRLKHLLPHFPMERYAKTSLEAKKEEGGEGFNFEDPVPPEKKEYKVDLYKGFRPHRHEDINRQYKEMQRRTGQYHQYLNVAGPKTDKLFLSMMNVNYLEAEYREMTGGSAAKFYRRKGLVTAEITNSAGGNIQIVIKLSDMLHLRAVQGNKFLGKQYKLILDSKVIYVEPVDMHMHNKKNIVPLHITFKRVEKLRPLAELSNKNRKTREKMMMYLFGKDYYKAPPSPYQGLTAHEERELKEKVANVYAQQETEREKGYSNYFNLNNDELAPHLAWMFKGSKY